MHLCNVKFKQRLLRYLIGVTIGCLLVYMMFPNYDWLGWLPGKQIRGNILSRHQTITDQAKCEASFYAIGEEEWKAVLADGSINFEKSKTKEVDKTYCLENNLITVEVLLKDSSVYIQHIQRMGVNSTNPCQAQ
jgi:hypothetical protein